jgi:HD-GYP domain-containing protein (c-di-GMP phosphodiesterase class II)
MSSPPLTILSKNISARDKLRQIHELLRKSFPFISRISVALYEEETDTLKTFIDSTDGDSPLVHYETRVSDAPALKRVIENEERRVVNDLSLFAEGNREHTKRVYESGYRSSYTLPIVYNSSFIGVVFFNSPLENVFSDESLASLDLFAQIVSLLVANEYLTSKVMNASLKTTHRILHYRDPETGNHLERMAQYSKIIAREVAEKHGLNDEVIENIFLYSPLHDIGKIGIPDEILLKPTGLTPAEYEKMKMHVTYGRQIVETLFTNFGIEMFKNPEILRNIVELHHERMDGSGYRNGLKGEAIPIEARIVAVADIFDALTSDRPYKKAWTNNDSFDMMIHMAGEKLDPDCVHALVAHRDRVEEVQRRFAD